MTENPLYRRVYNANNPLWRTPSEYPQMNLNPNAAQDLRNLLGDFFTRNYAQPYTPQYNPPQNFNSYQSSPFVNYNPNAPQQLKDAAYNAAMDEGVQTAAILAASNGAAKGFGGLASMYYPYAAAMLGATRFGAPIVNGINKFANSPAGKVVGKVADLFW